MGIDLSALSRFESAMNVATQQLTKLITRPQARTIIRKAMQVVVDDAKARVNRRSQKNSLQDAIKIRFSDRWDDVLLAELGVSYKRTRAYHAHLVEDGHAPPGPYKRRGKTYYKSDARVAGARADARSGRNMWHEDAWRTPAHPYWRPALDANKDRVLDAVEAAINNVLDQTLGK